MRRCVAALAGIVLSVLLQPVAHADTPVGTQIRNVAAVSYGTSGALVTVNSNPVVAAVVNPASASSLSILRTSIDTTATSVAPTQCRSGTGIVTLAAPTAASGQVIDLSRGVSLAQTSTLHGGEAVFLRLTDADQNVDATAIDYVQIQLSTPAGDREVLRLAETAPDAGVFVGFIQTRASAAVAGDCVLQVERNARIDSQYVDPLDSRDISTASALVDPYGLVFNSATGQAIDGARVRLIDAATGEAATVYGDDGISRYPSEMVTGESITDAGGTTYSLPAGVFRFPLVTPGNYRLEVDPPSGHVFPTALDVGQLAQTPGAPFRLSDGSFGRPFAIESMPTVAIDVPVDPAPTQLFMQKSTPTTVAAVGDFVQYTLTVENTSKAAVSDVRVVDHLPRGARYRAGSARANGTVIADPAISADGRTLTFTQARLAAGQRAEIRYVIEVTVGVQGRELVNAAQAAAPDGTVSNTAQATVQLREELFRERAILMGRVVEGSCGALAHELGGVAGVRVYLEDGRYSITDANGKYHFDDVAPGSHVVQMDTATIPATHLTQTCGDRVRNAGSAYSQFVDVRGGALWRGDFVLARRQAPKGTLQLKFMTRTTADGLEHSAVLDTSGVAPSHVQTLVMLPQGLAYRAGSAMLDARPIEDPQVSGDVLTFGLGTLPADGTSTLTFATRSMPAARGGLSIRALTRFDTPAQPGRSTGVVENIALRGDMHYERAEYRFSPRFDVLDASIQPADRVQLDRIVDEWRGVTSLRLTAIGHTDALLIAASNRVAYPDNRALSLARARAVADYLASRLSIDPANVIVEGRGADEPVASGHDARSLALNRRVEIAIEGLRVVAVGELSLRTASAASDVVETSGVLSGVEAPKPRAAAQPAADAHDVDVEQLAQGVDWVYPASDELPAIPSINLGIRHLPAQHVELIVNGAAVDALNFDGTSGNAANTVALSRWRGVDLRDGSNTLVARVLDAQGNEVAKLKRTIHYAGGAVRAEIVREASTLIADGRTHPVVALRMIDASGKPARPGTLGAWSVDAPYRSWWEVESLDDNKLVATGPREPTFSVESDGLVRLELDPTTQSGTAVIHLKLSERQSQELRVWLEPQARDWILVGIAEGTTAYNRISQNMQSAAEAGLEEGYTDGNRVAFFAKGAIRGDALLTLAYDSARDREEAQNRLLGVVEPDRFYTLYGDATEQRFEAATSHKLFVKLERRQFAALFGDFETGLTVTELTRYSRTFTGLKIDYAGERFGYSAFAADSEQGYVKDELPGDGTSGLYRLSRRPLIINSDKVRIESRDRFHSDVVVESRELTRYIDYDIDYLNGTLFFKQPVPSRDPDFNPNYIVAEYEVLDGGRSQVTAGGRAALKFADDRVEVGASYIQQGADSGDTRVAGTDLRWLLAPTTELRAELARSESDDPAAADVATAWLTQLQHVSDRLEARAYAREQQAGFGVGQQMMSEQGTRKYGADARYRLSQRTFVEGETYRQQVLDTGAQRDYVSAEVRREAEDYTLGIGARHVADSGVASGVTSGNQAEVRNESEQAFVTGSVDLFEDLITVRASQDLPLGGKNSSVDFPARTLVGLDYHWRANATLFTEYEHADGENFDADMTRIGVRTTPWRRAQVQTSLSQQATEYGPRVFANVGLNQGWKASERWDLNFGVDQSRTVRGANLSPFDTDVPMASGTLNNDFLAAFAGAMYRSDVWTFTSRIEHRTSDDEQRWVLSGGFYREPVAGHAFSLSTQSYDSRSSNGLDSLASDVQLAWAYRPVQSAWIVLDRLDLKRESRSDTLGEFESARAINNLNANWQMNPWTQLGLQLGVRHVTSTFDDERYRGLSTLYGFDARRDLTARFDIGAHGTLLQSVDSGVSDASIGVDVGIVVARNVWISIGYNFAGFRDRDFEAARYTAQGPFIRFRMKADQDTFKDLSLDALRPQRQASAK